MINTGGDPAPVLGFLGSHLLGWRVGQFLASEGASHTFALVSANGQIGAKASDESKYAYQDVKMYLLALICRHANNGKLMFPHLTNPESNTKDFL